MERWGASNNNNQVNAIGPYHPTVTFLGSNGVEDALKKQLVLGAKNGGVIGVLSSLHLSHRGCQIA